MLLGVEPGAEGYVGRQRLDHVESKVSPILIKALLSKKFLLEYNPPQSQPLRSLNYQHSDTIMLPISLSTLTVAVFRLELRAPTPARAAELASLAIESGAESTTQQSSLVDIVHKMDDTDRWLIDLERALGWSATVLSESPWPAGSDDDWERAAQGPSFPPQLYRPLWVAPVQCQQQVPANCIPVFLLDGEAFLTTRHYSLHASTRMILELLVQNRRELTGGARAVLDFGCGSGVLGLSALALGSPSLRAYGTDVVEAALECAERNAQLNGLTERLRLYLPWEVPSSLQADVAVANMLAGPLCSVASEIASRVRPGALLLLTGFRLESLAAVTDAYSPYFSTGAGGQLEVVLQREGWVAVACRRTASTISSDALSELAVS